MRRLYRTKFLALFQIAVLLSLLSAPTSVKPGTVLQSHYISLEQKACRPLVGSMLTRYASQGLSVVDCPVVIATKPVPIGLLVVSSDERSWIELIMGDTAWSSEDEVVYEKQNQFGYFPNVGAAPAEILADSAGTAMGLIFRVTAQNPDRQSLNPGKANASRLFTLGFRKSGVCFLGITQDNTEARRLMESSTSCLRLLKSHSLY